MKLAKRYRCTKLAKRADIYISSTIAGKGLDIRAKMRRLYAKRRKLMQFVKRYIGCSVGYCGGKTPEKGDSLISVGIRQYGCTCSLLRELLNRNVEKPL